MRDEYPEWPSGADMDAYLHSYTNHFAVSEHFDFDTDIFAMEKRKDGEPGWTLYLK